MSIDVRQVMIKIYPSNALLSITPLRVHTSRLDLAFHIQHMEFIEKRKNSLKMMFNTQHIIDKSYISSNEPILETAKETLKTWLFVTF